MVAVRPRSWPQTALGFGLAFALGAASPPATPPAPKNEPVRAELDGLLQKKDYVELQKRVLEPRTHEELSAFLDWGRDRWLEGNSAAVPFIQSRLLWSVASSNPRLADLKMTAASALLYVLVVVRIDGARCGDRTAPNDRFFKIAHAGRELLAFAAAASPDDREQMISLAELAERKTALVRDEKGDVDFVCRYGLEETTYNMTHGSAREVPEQPGQFGRQIVLSGDGNYKPSVRPEADWKPEVAKLRASLHADLEALLTGSAPAAK